MELYVGGPDKLRTELIAIRSRLSYTQAQMAHALGMSLRAYSDIENGLSKCRPIHLMAAERLSSYRAYQDQNLELLSPWMRRDVEGIKNLLSRP